MALLSRFGCFSNNSCKNILFSSVKRISFYHIGYRKLLSPNIQLTQTVSHLQQRYQSTNGEPSKKKTTSSTEAMAGNKLTQRARLKQAVRDYGATIIVFHVAISLASLGLFYLAVSNGVDAVSLLTRIGLPESVISSNIAVGGSTFVMAYAVHKVFAPARIAITLSAAPFIVRYLRKINLLKPPK